MGLKLPQGRHLPPPKPRVFSPSSPPRAPRLPKVEKKDEMEETFIIIARQWVKQYQTNVIKNQYCNVGFTMKKVWAWLKKTDPQFNTWKETLPSQIREILEGSN